ncbi:ABL037Cp [Eremothecium gossypii ATCC 10895]|uniref:Eisosome protein SEG1 n=1 Tax=Eremothecium gossypii (strain ATCC 10895 / CBS 109.51 / FGSC 9923 / NRRL Y-1056) TaxID=284811 RepID=SEG1_EREGS|nr:ABL037Cp [Eremothecium gossypii ATCC 10895]Q75DQ4.2 RecName: Full=Eisosome protein SEG1; AltName: Full=Stabilizer of eisosome in gossypii protein 1 [Eremothecium gossypii ATCC 10895]AAS50734.2 ABL037Cp [Eremothecium gossypii ATCC 10895]
MLRKQTPGRARPADVEAVAAVSALGKVMNQDGTALDHSKVRKRESMLPTRGRSGRGGVRRASAESAGRRTRSEDGKAARSARERHMEDEFNAFGGRATAGVAKEVPARGGADDGPVMTTKYVPSPRGLVKVTVPVSAGSSAHSSLRKSASIHTGMNMRHGSGSRRASMTSAGSDAARRQAKSTAESSSARTRSNKPKPRPSGDSHSPSPTTRAPVTPRRTTVKDLVAPPLPEEPEDSVSTSGKGESIVPLNEKEEEQDEQPFDSEANARSSPKTPKQGGHVPALEVSQHGFQTPVPDGPTMAEYLQSADPILSAGATQRQRELEEAEAASTTPDGDRLKIGKSPSPMKSAMKNSPSAGTSKYNRPPLDTSSAADGAYLSLTTAENTRLNAQLSDDKMRKSPTLRQPKRRVSVHSPKTPSAASADRSSKVLRQFSLSKPQGRTLAMNKNNSGEKQAQSPTSPKSNQKKVDPSVLYPREPPKKKSSFERERPQHKNLGFKNLSLRSEASNEFMYQGTLEGEIHQSPGQHVGHETPKKALLSVTAEGWKSRFSDSDSENDSPPFSSNASGSTQPSSHRDSSLAHHGGFGLFKHKDHHGHKPKHSLGASLASAKPHEPQKARLAPTSNRGSNTLSAERPLKNHNSFSGKLKKLFGKKHAT